MVLTWFWILPVLKPVRAAHSLWFCHYNNNPFNGPHPQGKSTPHHDLRLFASPQSG